jgi:hypothetical protein
MFAHSYGGVVATEAVHADFGVEAVRAKSQKGGVIRILFCAAFVLPLGESLEVHSVAALHQIQSCHLSFR